MEGINDERGTSAILIVLLLVLLYVFNLKALIIIIIIKFLFQEDDIFSNNTNFTYGPLIHEYKYNGHIYTNTYTKCLGLFMQSMIPF